jgi:hypothetical protein
VHAFWRLLCALAASDLSYPNGQTSVTVDRPVGNTERRSQASRRRAMLERLDPCDPGRPEWQPIETRYSNGSRTLGKRRKTKPASVVRGGDH